MNLRLDAFAIFNINIYICLAQHSVLVHHHMYSFYGSSLDTINGNNP